MKCAMNDIIDFTIVTTYYILKRMFCICRLSQLCQVRQLKDVVQYQQYQPILPLLLYCKKTPTYKSLVSIIQGHGPLKNVLIGEANFDCQSRDLWFS